MNIVDYFMCWVVFIAFYLIFMTYNSLIPSDDNKTIKKDSKLHSQSDIFLNIKIK